jgi:predicted HTH domain antitoxin
METVKVDLPSALVKAANLEGDNLSQDAARLLALELYREDKVSLGRAAELCQTPLATFMDFVAKHGVPPCATVSRIWTRNAAPVMLSKRDRRRRFITARHSGKA